MNQDRLALRAEKGIFPLVLFILVFGPLAAGAVPITAFVVIQGAAAIVAVLWSFRLWFERDFRILWPPISWVVLVFLAYSIVQYHRADIEYVARLELMRIVVYALLFFALLHNLNRQEHARWIMLTMVSLGMLLAMYAVCQFATGWDRVWTLPNTHYRGRGTGTYFNPNHLVGLLEMILPLGLSYTIMGRIGHLMRIYLGYASLVILAGIGVTVSRGGWIATCLALLMLFGLLAFRRGYRLPVIVALVVLLVGSVGIATRSQFVKRRLELIAKPESGTNLSRQWIWQAAYRMWQDHFWTGVGPAHFDHRFRAYRPNFPEISGRPDRAHNDYLNTLADWGVIGAAILSVGCGLLFWGILKTWKFVRRESTEFGTRTGNRAALVIGASTGLLAILIHSFTDFNMHIPANALLAVVLAALLTSHLRYASEQYWVNPGVLTRSALTLILIASSFYLGKEAIKRYSEESWLKQSDRAEKYSSQQVDLLKRAYAIEPKNYETVYAIGEGLRIQGMPGHSGLDRRTVEAMQWFRLGMHLNRHYPYNYLRYGMCLHWLGRHTETEPWFKEAVRLDPNHYYIRAIMGWHYVQLEDYAAAKYWLDRSWALNNIPSQNRTAYSYLNVVNGKLAEAAAQSKSTPTPPLPAR
jgi:O-antigen ligase